MKHKKITLMALAMTMGLALTGCGSKDAASAKDTTVATVEENTVETPAEETESESEAESEVIKDDDPTYASLKSDPYFDWDNAIEDTKGEEVLADRGISEITGKTQLLYNIVDGDKYIEVTGANVYEVNKTFNEKVIPLYKNLAYYGAGVTQSRFVCMNETYYESDDKSRAHGDFTVLKAYNIPIDENNHIGGYLAITYVGEYETLHSDKSQDYYLCEVEYNGEHYWTDALPAIELGIIE